MPHNMPMPKMDMGPVGASASASKKDVGGRGSEILTDVTLKLAENGGYTVRQSYKMEPPKGRKGDSFPAYVEPKDFVFESWETARAHLDGLFGAGGGSANPGDMDY